MATARRGHGEGSVHKRKDGRYAATVELGRDPSGKRLRKTVYAKSKRDVLAKLDKAREAASKGLPALDQRTTVGQWLDQWLRTVEGDLAPSSLITYKAAVTRMRPTLGHIKLSALGPGHVEAMLQELRDRGMSHATRRQTRTVLRRALSVAERHGHIHRNAAALAEGPRRRDDKARVDDTLSRKQADKIIAAAEGDRLAALPVLLLALGLRKGEALALRWEDLRLSGKEPELTVAASLSRVKGQGLVRSDTKTVGSARTIPLVEPALSALKAHRKSQARERLAAEVWVDDGIVFSTEHGQYLDPRNALRIWHGWTETAGLGKRRMHSSRHTAATLLLEAGVPLEVVSAALGHSSLSITADVYARVSQDAKRRALASISRISE